MRSRPSPRDSARSALSRRLHEPSLGDLGRAPRLVGPGVLVHQPSREALVETPPVDTDPHRPSVLDRGLDHRREARVALLPKPTFPGLIRYLARARAQSG